MHWLKPVATGRLALAALALLTRYAKGGSQAINSRRQSPGLLMQADVCQERKDRDAARLVRTNLQKQAN